MLKVCTGHVGAHCILNTVNLGLDFALLEQQRAREETRDDLDDDLESAFHGNSVETPPTGEPSTETQTQGKKRTRAELLAELKQSREVHEGQGAKSSTKEAEIEALERAKQAGKFKPMGSSSFAPVEKKKKKKKKAIAEEGKPKETKVVCPPNPSEKMASPANTPSQESAIATSTKEVVATQDTEPKAKADIFVPSVPPVLSDQVPAPPAEEIEDADPFADAGDYEPDYGDDESDAENAPKDIPQPSAPVGRRNWFNDPEPEPERETTKPPTPPPNPPEETDPEPGPARSMRLEGLTSSALPSISDFLAMDKEEELREKKRARKEKKKKAA